MATSPPSRESGSVTCPRCHGAGASKEWMVGRKVAMLAFLWVRRGMLCHVCRGMGVTSAWTAGKWEASRG